MATVPSTEHIEKCGYLKIKRPPSSGKVRLKAWQSKYFVLRGSPPIFEYFKDELSYHMTRGHKEINRISLENVIHIGTTDASKTQRNAFMIVSPHGALMFATDNEQDTKEWVEALNRVAIKPGTSQECPPDIASLVYPEQSSPVPRRSVPNVASAGSPVLGVDPGLRRASDPPAREGNNQGFLVITRLTPSSEKNGIRDKYRMRITDEHVVLHHLNSNVPFISWPLVDLRGWKCESAESAGRHGTQLLTLESGRKSATGVGLFQFFTNSGNQIAAKIRAHSNVLCESAVKKREKFKYDRSNSFEDLVHPSPPTGETIKKALTEPQPSSQKQAPSRNSVPRAESDSLLNFDKVERLKLSPNSLRKTLLQGMCVKDAIETKETESPVKEDADDPIAQPTDNTYLDLISESGVDPVHISDSEHRRTSTNSEEGALILKSRIPSIHESSEQSGYIDERELNTCGVHYQEKRGKSMKGFDSQSQDDESYSDATVTLKSSETSPTSKQTPATPDTQFCQDFFEQLSNPTAHKTSIFPQHHSQLKSAHQIGMSVKQESVILETSSDTKLTSADLNGKLCHRVLSETTKSSVTSLEASSSTMNVRSNEVFEIIGIIETEPEEPSREDIVSPNDIEFISGSVEHVPRDKENFHNLLKRSDETQDLLQKCLFQLESPQSFAKQDLFPPFPKRNSTGNVATDKMSFKKINDAKLKVKSLTVSSELGSKKIIEKSKSHSGFDSKIPSDKPPPLPARRELAGRTRSSASMGDIFEGVQRRPEQFPKGINRHHSPMSPHTPAFGASCGPESLVTARLLQRTTSGSNLVFEKKSSTHLLIQEPQEGKLSMADLDRPRSNSLRSSGHSASQSYEDDKNTDEGDSSKRRGSKASKFLNKVLNNFSLSPAVATTKRRASCDCLAPDGLRDVETRARSGSAINPGIDNEGWSPETSLDVPTPEGSPKHFRKSSSSLRRASHDPSLGRKSFFVGSPTFDKRDEMRERAKERERERAELPNQPPPALPPRKKSDPPPLPPRRRKSSGDHSCPSSPPSRTSSCEHPQSPAVKTSSSKGSSTRGAALGSSHDVQASPPPIPPRREERRGSHPPSIQLTASSPENKNLDNSLDGLPEEPMPSSSEEDATTVGKDSSEVPMAATGPPTISSTLSKSTDVSCPVPKRPPKTKGQWTRQQPIDLVDSVFVDEEISGPRDLILERKHAEISQGSCEGGSMRLETMDSAFISIGIHGQEQFHESHEHERLEVSEIELDSMANIIQSEMREIHESSNSMSSRPDMTDSLTPPLLPTGSTLGGTPGRCSPGHSPPHSLNMPNRGSGLVLGDSGSTTPISV